MFPNLYIFMEKGRLFLGKSNGRGICGAAFPVLFGNNERGIRFF